MRIFLSYAREDSRLAIDLARKLRDDGVDLWVDRLDIQPGEPFRRVIDEALESSAAVLVVLTPRSVLSQEVEAEWNAALRAGKTVVPVITEACRVPNRLAVLQCTDLTSGDADEIKRLASRIRALDSAGQPPPLRTASRPPDARRGRGALVGLGLGTAYGALAGLLVGATTDPREIVSGAIVFGLFGAVVGVIAGAIAGAHARALRSIVPGALVAGVLLEIGRAMYQGNPGSGILLGGALGAILAAAIWNRSRAH